MAATAVEDNNNTNIKGLLSGWGFTPRLCDTCRVATSLLYCKTDSSFLCGPCDAKIHPPTRYPRHERVWVCEVCEQAPAVVTCKADAAALCTACDQDIHSANTVSSRHERFPVIPFLDSPIDAATARSVIDNAAPYLVPDNLDAVPSLDNLINDEADAWLIPNPNNSFLYNDSDILNYSYNCTNSATAPQFQQQDIKPSIVVVDENRSYAFTDSVVPTQSQGNTNHFSTFSNNSATADSLFDSSFNIDFTQPNKQQKKNHHNFNHTQLFSPSLNYSVIHLFKYIYF